MGLGRERTRRVARQTNPDRGRADTCGAADAQCPRPAGLDTRRSLVRTAITLLLNQPALTVADEDLDWIKTLEQPGVPLLVDLIRYSRSRPGLNTPSLLEAHAEHPQIEALNKLAAQPLAGDEAGNTADFHGCIHQLRRQAIDQRLAWLNSQPELDEQGNAERRELLQLRR